MKNIINYYYQINLENIHLTNGIYYFTYQGSSFMLVQFNKSYELLTSLYKLNKLIRINNPYFYEIILTSNKTPYIFVDGKCFCLLRQSRVINDKLSFYDIPMDRVVVNKDISNLVRFPWKNFWQEKLDYLESVLNHLENNLSEIMPICLYFMGLAENANSYINETLTKKKDERDNYVVSHSRISVKDSVASLYMPLNLVIDHPSRDISEYLKSLFLENDYDFKEVEEYIYSLNFSDFGFSCLYGRILYPSFFFDLLDEVLLGNKTNKDIILIGERREEYRIYLKEIYYIIRRKTNIEEVRWITRE